MRRSDATPGHQRVAVTCMAAWVLAGTPLSLPAALAQEASPGGFSLPAGTPPQQQPPTDVQGPVDSESNPPRRTDRPAETAPAAALPSIAPVPVPNQQPRRVEPPRDRAASRPQERQQPLPQAERPAAQVSPEANDPASPADSPAISPLPAPALPEVPSATQDPEATTEPDAADGSLWWWLGAGLVALISLIVMALRRRTAARAPSEKPEEAFVPAATVPTPPLRTPPPAVQPPPEPAAAAPATAAKTSSVPFGTLQGGGPSFGASPPPAPAPAPAAAPAPGNADLHNQTMTAEALAASAAPVPAAAASAALPRLLLDFTTLGVDVTLVNAIARYHLAITNMSDIPVSDVALHGTVVQARRGMPPTIDPMRGDSLLPLLQQLQDIAAESTQRCEGQIRLPLAQIEPIEMQGRLLFVPVVHIWIGYSGPDGTRYAVTQSFVLGEESSPPGARVGPLRLDLGPRRFTEVGQRPLQPA